MLLTCHERSARSHKRDDEGTREHTLAIGDSVAGLVGA